MTTHLHITSWALAIILFVLALIFTKQGKYKAAKILQMITRVLYLVILYSGGQLLMVYFDNNSPLMNEVMFKVMAGIWVIVSMEMITVKSKGDGGTKGWWISLIIAFVIALALGFGRLPLGILPK